MALLFLLSLSVLAGEEGDSSDPSEGWEDAKAILKQIQYDEKHGPTELCYRAVGKEMTVQLYEKVEAGTRPVAGAFGPTLKDAIEGLPSEPRFCYVALESVVPCESVSLDE